ncbi:MAG: ABC transporter ATP-binding protein [Alphaproteobacteria bacterium]
MSGLEIDSICWRYGDREVLNNISLAVAPGTFCALLGPNGAGKTTLFALATRLFHARTGRILIDGIDLARDPGAALARLGIVFQQPTLDLDLSVAHNLEYFGALHGLSARDTMRRSGEMLELLGLAERLRDKVRTLNGGHRRRLEIARALIHGPSVLLLDEPTVGLDVATRRAITDHVHDLCDRLGVAVLWATHLVDEVRDGDAVVVLHHGCIVAHGSTREVAEAASAPDLVSAFSRLTATNANGVAAQ